MHTQMLQEILAQGDLAHGFGRVLATNARGNRLIFKRAPSQSVFAVIRAIAAVVE